MKKLIPTLSSLTALLLLNSCIEQETTLYWKKDGTGMLDVITKLDHDRIGGIPDGANLDHAALAEKQAKAVAAEYGEGVTLVKFHYNMDTQPASSHATYRIDNINNLKIRLPIGIRQKSSVATGQEAESQTSITTKPMFAFQHKDGVLTILPDKPKGAADTPAPAAQPKPARPGAEEMMKTILEGVKIHIKVIPESGIADTDATHRDGNTVTLLEFDADEFLKKPDNLRAFTGIAPGTNPLTMQQTLQNIDGIKLNPHYEIIVRAK